MKKIISLAAALALLVAPAVSLASYGWGSSSIGSSLQKDTCPGGDYSNSYYDNSCGTNPADVTDDNDDMEGLILDGYIFFDVDRSGSMDNGEQGVQGAVVTLKSSGWAILDTDVSGSNGYYAFYNVQPGTYRVHVSLPATKTTFVQDLLAVLSPSVSAANDYEFTVVIGDEDVRLQNVPVVDWEATSVNVPDTMEEEMDNDDNSESILDIIKNSNANNNTATNSPTSSIGNNDNGNGGFALPAFLPNTWASL